ncbi:shikimate kinase [Baaleninema sp.]|uniref:shikimate kinase n=1 Tax=Baaleninema sp. TaxID=3101197 RepID=UPI003D01895E
MNDILQGLNIYLVGMMGAGKTTVGQHLAHRLGYRFLDTDAIIEQATGTTINEIFAQDGEPTFRDIEHQVLAQVAAYQHSVVSTGGGIVTQQKNWSYLKYGLVVWLDVPPKTLFDRLQDDSSRPLLKEADPLAKLQRLLDERRSKYEQADLHLSIGGNESSDRIVDRLLTAIPTILKPPTEPPNGSHS